MSLSLPESVSIVEMLPRDGFQSHDEFVPTQTKVDFIDALSTTGVDEIEITGFVHPDSVPNLRDAAEVVASIDRHDDVTYRALVPNAVGMERALQADIDKVNALVTVSEKYSQHNQNMSLAESIQEITGIVELAGGTDVTVEAGIGTSFFCPYEGRIAPERTLDVVEAVIDAGVDEVTLATTMGMANPVQVHNLFTTIDERWSDTDFGLHLHNTNGMSLANTLIALQCGVSRFDGSVCGLGGGTILPDGLASVGNTPTEDLVNMLRQMDVTTGVDFSRLTDVAIDVNDQLGLASLSHILGGGTPEQVLQTTAGASDDG